MNKTALAAIFTIVISTVAHAGDVCTLVIDRTPCSDKYKNEVFKPYGGKNPTKEEHPELKTEEECLKEASAKAEIIRKKQISKKVVKVSFGGKEIGTKEDTSTKCEK